ncbi:MAG: ribosome recycling factor [Arsenophonus sp.]|nr:MAG: ribosome recycling factor [Arsenophonus sp.]
MINEIQHNTKKYMLKSLDLFKDTIQKIRTGRPSIHLLDHIMVEYYGVFTPLNKLANVVLENNNLLMITVFDATAVSNIQKSILSSNLNLYPSIMEHNKIRIPLPELTYERKKEFIKTVIFYSEQSKISIRNIRRESNEKIKKLVKKKNVTKDDEYRLLADIQKITDFFINEIDLLLKKKIKELKGN